MAEAVVEKILKEDLIQLQLKHSTLKQDLAEVTALRDQLLKQVP